MRQTHVFPLIFFFLFSDLFFTQFLILAISLSTYLSRWHSLTQTATRNSNQFGRYVLINENKKKSKFVSHKQWWLIVRNVNVPSENAISTKMSHFVIVFYVLVFIRRSFVPDFLWREEKKASGASNAINMQKGKENHNNKVIQSLIMVCVLFSLVRCFQQNKNEWT